MKEIPLELITTEQGIYPRMRTKKETVERYADAMEEGAEFPPIVVFEKGGKYVLLDGFHRKEAAEKIGRIKIKAEILDIDPNDTLALLREAIKRNLEHGLPLTKQDLIRMSWTFYENGMPVKEISKLFKTPERTVHRWLEPLKELKRMEREELKKKAWQLYKQGWTLRQIMEELNIPKSTLHDWLSETAILAVSDRDEFLAEELVTDRVKELVEYAKRISDFLARVAVDTYKMMDEIRKLEWWNKMVEALRELPEDSLEHKMLREQFYGACKNVEMLASVLNAAIDGNKAVKEAYKEIKSVYE